MIEEPFHSLVEVINPQRPPSVMMSNLLSSPATPLCTALVFMLSSCQSHIRFGSLASEIFRFYSIAPSSLETLLIDTLGPRIPIILLPRLTSRAPTPIPNHTVSSFRPTSVTALQRGLFRSPETLALLRAEAVDRFVRWREVERAIADLSGPLTYPKVQESEWSKKEWEAEWEGMLSQDVAEARRVRDRDNTVTQADSLAHLSRTRDSSSSFCINPSFDPLHFPSLVLFSLSLLRPARRQLGASIWGFVGKLMDWEVGFAMVGSFCIGIGIGLLLK
jgi:hypothetical protein